MTLPDFDPRRFAGAWIAAWNAHDLETVLEHYADDIAFFSPIAGQVVGRPELRGKDELRAYWQKALATRTTLHFDLDDVAWEPGSRLLCLLYQSNSEGGNMMVCECQWLDETGRVVKASAYYGADLSMAASGR